jgi:hypothetical protein
MIAPGYPVCVMNLLTTVYSCSREQFVRWDTFYVLWLLLVDRLDPFLLVNNNFVGRALRFQARGSDTSLV